ncbi:MAG: FAD-dependent monooxygenase [Acidobacteriota bacterium]|nr:FAD-dependent monooxygenase [Acidobacteriota bacterium]
MDAYAVVIAGGGPTGMMLAAELVLAGTDVVIVERRLTPEVDGSRAGGLHARTLEVLDQRGVVDRFLAEGQSVQTNGFAYIPLDISGFPSRHSHGLALWQNDIERIMAGWVDELGVRFRRGVEVVGAVPDDDGVDVELSDGSKLRSRYLIGCDGGRSRVRQAAGIAFEGYDAATSYLIAQAHFEATPEVGVRREGGGIGPVDRVSGGNPYGIVLREERADHADGPSLDDLRALLVDKYRTDWGVHDPIWISRFTDAARQAVSYRAGRMLVAGDAAHIHSPMGGLGLNTGVQDAVNLGWKLAQVVAGTSPDSLLDTYHAERHPVGASVLRLAMAQSALVTPDDFHDQLRRTVAEMLSGTDAGTALAGTMSGLGIRYDLGDGHPLVGWRMADLDLRTADGDTRVFELLRPAQPLLINLDRAATFDIGPWAGRVRQVDAETEHLATWQLPVVGAVPAAPAVLLRPDGHVAWAGRLDELGLPAALSRWFGSRRARPV